MAQGLRPLLIFLFTAFVYSNSYAGKVLTMDGTSLSLASGLDVKPSSVASSELETETPSLEKVQQHTIITVYTTIKPTPLLTPTLIEPTEVAEGTIDAIAPTSVVTTSASGTLDVPAVDAPSPKKSES